MFIADYFAKESESYRTIYRIVQCFEKNMPTEGQSGDGLEAAKIPKYEAKLLK